MTDVRNLVVDLARNAKSASRVLGSISSERKNAALSRVASALRGPESKRMLDANAKDITLASQAGLSTAMIDRLRLDPSRLNGIADGVEQIIALADPVGEVVGMRRLPNGLVAGRMRVPLGVVGMIYESRPNVTVDAAALCLKSGNAVVLRGGSEAFHSNQAFATVFAAALEAEGLPAAAVGLIPTTDREATNALIALDGLIDLVIPRGGEALIRFVAENARVPVIRHYKGVCHVYIDNEADLDMAVSIVINSKTQRPGVCNALETLLVDSEVADKFLPRIGKVLRDKGVELRGDQRVLQRLPDVREATESDWDEEYLDLILSIGIVDGIDGALAHIAKHGTNHTEAIVTKNYDKAQRWIREVDASLVLVNASTRFNDGYQLGLGAEMGISTSKLHAYGPMGLAELCTLKWIAYGSGNIRT